MSSSSSGGGGGTLGPEMKAAGLATLSKREADVVDAGAAADWGVDA
jgi:hypothetical protein